jgi:hypothetical protein
MDVFMSRRRKHHAAVGIFALRVTYDAGQGTCRVMHNLAVHGAHRFKHPALPSSGYVVGDLLSEGLKGNAATLPVTGNVEEYSGWRIANPVVDRSPKQFLHSLEGLRFGSDKHAKASRITFDAELQVWSLNSRGHGGVHTECTDKTLKELSACGNNLVIGCIASLAWLYLTRRARRSGSTFGAG